MPEKISILLPTAKDEDEYLEVAARLGQTSALMLYASDRDRMSEREWKEASVYLTARRIYDLFYIYAREHNRSLYLTRDDLARELRDYTDLEDAIKYLLSRGLIKEEIGDIT